MKIHYLKIYYPMIFFTCSLLPLVTSATIITDGSLGAQTTLHGTEYQITPELGQQVGSNLFHSFTQFNLEADEIALFSGAPEIQNVISRITNNQPSYIDGTIRTTLPHADMYFLNPAGIVFGEHAKLDVLGSFYASSADTLHFTDGGEFNARTPTLSLLTTAPIKDFGFLTDTPAALHLTDSQLQLSAPTQQFSLIGGDLNLQHAKVQAGRINLLSVAGRTTVSLDEIDANAAGGMITLQNSELNTSGEGGGKIWIRGGQFIGNDSTLQANTLGKLAGQGIDITTSESIAINAINGEQVALSSITSGAGDAGTIHLSTPELTMRGSVLDSSSLGAGKSGDIHIQTQRTQLTQGAAMVNETFADGQSGNIEIEATQSLTLNGKRTGTLNLAGRSLGADNPSWISTMTFGDQNAGDILIHAGDINLSTGMISSMSLGTGNGGNISMYGNRLQLLDGGLIDSLGMTHGGAGSITTHIAGDIDITGFYPGVLVIPGLEISDTESGINSVTFGIKNAGNIDIVARKLTINAAAIAASTLSDGNAGLITINAESIHLEQGGQIDSTSGLILGDTLMVGMGDGGSMVINANKEITIQDTIDGFYSGIFTSTYSSGKAGNIELNTPRLLISATNGIATHSQGNNNAGHIHIHSDDIILSDQGKMGSESQDSQNATGGTIALEVSHLLYVDHSQISTSVKSGSGSGGNVEVNDPQFVVLNRGIIKAQAEAGDGGNIRITAENFIKSSDSLVSASSRLGIDGKVIIKSPGENVSSSLLSLNNNFLDASSLFPQSCRAKTAGQRPSEFVRPFTFTVNIFNQYPNAPEDLVASRRSCQP